MQPHTMMKNNDSRGFKVLLLLLALILFTIASFAQGGYTRPNTNYGTRMYRLGVDSAIGIPTGCGTPTSLKSTDLKQAMLFYDSCNAAMFVRNPKTNTWVELAAGGSVVYVDSIYTMPDSAKLFYTKNSNVYSIDLVAALSGGDSSIFEQIVDTTNIESFAIPYADTSGRFKADSALRFQPSTKTVITNNMYLYGTTASQPGKLWLKQANPSGGQRPVVYSGLVPEDFGNGAIHFSGGGSNALMEINSGDNNDLLLHSPDGSMLFKQTDGLYRYYYLPNNTSTRKVLVTDDSGYVAWNVIDSLVSSLAAGNGIDITNGIVKLDDTLRTDTRFIAMADSGITNLEMMGVGTGGLTAQGLKIYPHLGLLHLYAYEPGAGGSLFMYGNGEVTLIGKPLHLNADSLYLDKPGGGPYGPTATDMSKYKVVLMDSTTGAMTTAPLDSLGTGGGGGGITAVKQTTAPSDTTTLWIDNNADNNGFEITKIYSNGSWHAVSYKDVLSGYVSNLPPLYVLATGQSNMQEFNQSGIPTGDLTTDNRVQKWNGSAWAVANPSPANGLAFQFAKRVAKSESRVVRYLNVALDGASIENWYDGATVDASIASAITASGVDSIDVILFRQGESNPGDTEAQYKAKVDSIVNLWRSRSWFNNIRPIVAGGLKTTNSGTTLENYGSQKFYQNIPYQYKDLGMLYADNNNINIPVANIHIYGAGMDSSAARMYAAYTSRSHVLAPQASFTLSNIGNTPNAAGATVTGTNLNLEPASASFGGVLTTGPQTIAGPKTLNDTLTIPNFSRITFGSSAGSGIKKRLVFDYLGSETYDIRSSAEFNMIVNVPTGKRIDFHSGNYGGGTGNLMQLDATAITFGAPIGGTYSNLTANTTSGPVGGRIYVRDGGTAARYGMGWTGFEYQFTIPSGGRMGFTTNGNIQDGSVNTLFVNNGWVFYGSTKGSQNGDPGARSALTVSTTTQGSIPAPVMTETQRNALSSPPSGLRVFNSTTSQPNYRDGSTWQAQVGMTFGTAAPTSTPTAVGNFFLDTTNKKLYVATGTASSADWNILN